MFDGKYSVRDTFFILLRMKVYDPGKQEMPGGIPKKASELVQNLR